MRTARIRAAAGRPRWPRRPVRAPLAGEDPTGRARPSRAVLAQLVTSILLLGTVALLTLGASGILAAGIGLTAGKDFVAGDAPGVTYTPARCAQYREYEPGATSCGQAAVAHHFGEVVGNQIAAGILGLLSLALYRPARRRLLRRHADVDVLPDGFVATVGASLFGVAAGFLLLQSAGQIVFSSGSTTGGALALGLACLLAAAAFLPTLYRALASCPDLPPRPSR